MHLCRRRLTTNILDDKCIAVFAPSCDILMGRVLEHAASTLAVMVGYGCDDAVYR
jgi:hypothetical protein